MIFNASSCISSSIMNAILRQHASSLRILRLISTSPSNPSDSSSLIHRHASPIFSLLARNCSSSRLALSCDFLGFHSTSNNFNTNCSSHPSRASTRLSDSGDAFNFLSIVDSNVGKSKGFNPNLYSPGLHYFSSLATIKPRDLNFLRTSMRYATRISEADVDEKDGAAEILARGWQITEEGGGDWRGHAAAVARSLQLIKARMRWKEVLLRLKRLEVELERSDLWQNPQTATNYSQECGILSTKVHDVKNIERQLLEHVGMAELAREENDSQIELETTKALEKLRRVTKEAELAALLSGEYDAYSCFLEVQAGAGGTESMDWAAMVLRMYKMWAQRRNFEVTVIEEIPGEEAGIKRATLQLDGQFAYGYAKSEAGVHRLVRISPFDSGKRRHTSFSAVAVIPMLDKSLTEVEINEADIRIERYRAGGPGGQHANKTESAVRIIHIPTGLTASSQSQRSQHQNRQIAMDVLQARIHQKEKERQAHAAAQHTQSLSEISWGNQIRSYVLQPYQVVKDLRTGFEVSDPSSVLDGDLDGFIMEFLASTTSKKAA